MGSHGVGGEGGVRWNPTFRYHEDAVLAELLVLLLGLDVTPRHDVVDCRLVLGMDLVVATRSIVLLEHGLQHRAADVALELPVELRLLARRLLALLLLALPAFLLLLAPLLLLALLLLLASILFLRECLLAIALAIALRGRLLALRLLALQRRVVLEDL